MIGFCGASRSYSDEYQEGFPPECKAIKKLREVIGFTNVVIMIPFCRFYCTLSEAEPELGYSETIRHTPLRYRSINVEYFIKRWVLIMHQVTNPLKLPERR